MGKRFEQILHQRAPDKIRQQKNAEQLTTPIHYHPPIRMAKTKAQQNNKKLTRSSAEEHGE